MEKTAHPTSRGILLRPAQAPGGHEAIDLVSDGDGRAGLSGLPAGPAAPLGIDRLAQQFLRREPELGTEGFDV